jgi:hypothetical protein
MDIAQPTREDLLHRIYEDLGGAKPVICAKTALAAFDAIVRQGEGAQADTQDSHCQSARSAAH